MTPEELGPVVTAGVAGSAATVAFGELTVDVPLDGWVVAAEFCAADPAVACDFFDWLSAVDLSAPDGGDVFAVVCHLFSPSQRHRLRLRTRVTGAGVVPTLVGLFPGADWHERETHEMFGITFGGGAHVPLLLADGFGAHPLRKDFVLASRAVTPWPGLVEPGEEGGGRRPTLPPGVPADGWGAES